MAFNNEKCNECGRTLANTKYTRGEKALCPICVLGEKEGGQSKYWETSSVKKPEGFRYPDDTATYTYNWDKSKRAWVDKDGYKRPEWDEKNEKWLPKEKT